jgi:hypothetical protein
MSTASAKAINARGGRQRQFAQRLRYARVGRGDASKHLDTYEERGPMARKKAPSNQGEVWTTKDFVAIRRLVKTGATGKTIAKKIGRSVVALYQKASIEGISLSARPTVRRSAVAKKAKALAASKTRRSR